MAEAIKKARAGWGGGVELLGHKLPARAARLQEARSAAGQRPGEALPGGITRCAAPATPPPHHTSPTTNHLTQPLPTRGPPPHTLQLSPECKDLLNRIFVIDAKKRITIEDIERHPW